MSVTAIVLAGGRASRFGSAKLAARLDGRSLLDHAIEAVGAVATETIVVVAPDGAAPPPRHGVRTVRDPEAFGGPLVGLAAGLESTTGDLAIVVGGDMPRLRTAVLEAMLVKLQATDDGQTAVVLEQVGGPRPLPLAIVVEPARGAVAATLAAGQRSLWALLDRLDVYAIPAEVWRFLDPFGETLIDIDRPEDLERLGASDPGEGGLP